MNFTLEQLSAINEEGNIIVSAGAGSGKTAVLSERVIRKIKDGIHINQLLILTFTEAAAKEMKDRIRKKLIKNNLLEEILYIDSAFITTFDSYALSIVKKYYYLLNINPDIKIITNLDIEKSKILDNIFEERYLNDEKFKQMIDELCVKDDINIKNYLLELSNKISLNIDYKKYLDNYINNYYDNKLIEKNISNYINIIKENINVINRLLDDIRLLDDNEYYNNLYDVLFSLISSNTYDDIKNSINIELPRLPRNSSDELKQYKEKIMFYLKNIKSLIKYDDLNEYKQEILLTKNYSLVIIDILKEYFKLLEQYKKEINRYEFNDIAHMAIKVVEDNEEVKEELKNSFNEIMIDEYQDTNDIQEYFISLISNNNVYCVGDIKQSIYRFRNANPLIFKNKYELYKNNKNGKKIDLNKNFRSRDIILDDVNNIFNNLMDIKYGEANYKQEHQLLFGNKMYSEKKKEEQNYHLEILKYEESEDYSNEEAEIFLIADDIIDKINNKYQVIDNGELRNVKYEDFAILIDRSTNFDLIKKIFEYKKIPLTILKDETINNSLELYLFKNLLTLLLKYNQKQIDVEFKYSLVSILRSYLIGYTDEEILELFIKNDYLNNIVIDKIKNIKLTSINDVLNRIIEEFDIYNKLVNVGDIDSKANLIKYILTLGEEKTSIGYDIEDFNNYLNDLINYKLDVQYSVESNKYGVKLMTIYKSKGLEFPICYMPMLYKGFNISDIKELITYDQELGIILPYYLDGIKSTFYKDLLKYKYIYNEISEKIRLFYVGLTRAKEKLILLNLDKNNKQNYDKNSYRSFKDFIDSLEPYLDFKSVIPKVDKNYKKIIDINKLVINTESNKINNINIKKIKQEKQKYSHSSIDLITKEQYDNMKYGIKLHEKLEEFDLNDEMVKKFINHDEIKNIEKANIYHEYEFIYNGNIGIIDLILEYENEIIIVDFKTEEIDKKEYISQVKKYVEYIKSITDKKVIGLLYSIINDKFMEVL